MEHLPLIRYREYQDKRREDNWIAMGKQIIDHYEDNFNEFWWDYCWARSVGKAILCGESIIDI